MQMDGRATNWCFTLNNYTDAEIPTELPKGMKFFRYSKEVGSTGTPHLQGFCGWTNAVRYATLAKWLPRAYFDRMRGRIEQNEKYCSKENELIGLGELPKTPKKAAELTKEHWSEIMNLVKLRDYATLEANYPAQWMRYHKSWTNYRTPTKPCLETHDKIENWWVHGETGSGKSTQIRLWLEKQGIPYYVKTQSKWWDDYNNEEWVILEEVSPDWKGISKLKVWGDRFPFPAEYKGGSNMINPKHIYVTSNYSMEDCFPYNMEQRRSNMDLAPMKRRFDEIKMNKKFDYATQKDNPLPFSPSVPPPPIASIFRKRKNTDDICTSSDLLNKLKK